MNKKNCIYCFLNDIINAENFNPINIKIDEKSYQNILIYYIGYVTIKEYVNIYSVNPLYLIFKNVNGYYEEINKSKYLTLVLTKQSKIKYIYIYIYIYIRVMYIYIYTRVFHHSLYIYIYIYI